MAIYSEPPKKKTFPAKKSTEDVTMNEDSKEEEAPKEEGDKDEDMSDDEGVKEEKNSSEKVEEVPVEPKLNDD